MSLGFGPFIEVQFPTNLSYGAIGGPGWSTRIIVTNSGSEYRFQHWGQALGKWTVGHNLRTPTQWGQLLAFHRLTQGKRIGFRYQDWTDYTHEAGPGTGLNAGSIGTNSLGQLQLYKNYSLVDEITSTVYSQTRPIYKPQPGTITIKNNTNTILRTGWALDYTTGALFTNGTVVSGDHWYGQFDVPVRFDTDEPMISVDKPSGAGWRGIPLIELRTPIQASAPAALWRIPGFSTNQFSGTSGTVNISTTTINNIIILFFNGVAYPTGPNPTVTSVTGGGLSWQKRKSITFTSASPSPVEYGFQELWWASSAGILTSVPITFSFSNATYQGEIIAVNAGAFNVIPSWDPNSSLTATGTDVTGIHSFGGAVSGISTSKSENLLLAFGGDIATARVFGGGPPGWTKIQEVTNSDSNSGAYYKVVTAPQYNILVQVGSLEVLNWSCMVDALTVSP